MGSAADARNSRHIFQHTHNNRIPPARRRPTICRICVANPANRMRNIVAATMPIRIALPRCAALVPERRRPRFVEGVIRRVEIQGGLLM